MVKSSITKDDVYAAALAVQQEGELPTTINVRAKLDGRGSQTTIHKHLTRWKKLYANDDGQSIDTLRAKLSEQQQITQSLTSEVLNADILITSLRDENTKLRSKVLELEVRVDEKDLAAIQLAKRNADTELSLKTSFDTSVLLLSEQLRSINEQAISKVQEVGQHFDDKLIDLKLELRSLKEQLTLKDKEIKRLKLTENADRGVNDYSN